MKNFKTLLLTLIFSIGFILPGCKKDFIDQCGNIESFPYFDINGLDALVYKNSPNGFEIFNSTDTLAFSDDLGIYMLYEADFHAALSPSIGLINSTLACSPIASGYDGSKTEKLVDISIITLNDFDKEHLANSSINDLLEVTFYYQEGNDLPLVEYLANQTENIKYQTLLLRLEKAPELNSEFLCRIQVKLSTGEIYSTENIPIYFRE